MASRNFLTRVGLALWLSISVAQTSGQKLSEEKQSPSPSHQAAVGLLDSTLDELREIEDLSVRVTLTEDVLKLLSKDKPERCRRALDALFEEALRLKDERNAQSGARQVEPDALIRRIIQLSAGVERKLADSYVERYATRESAQKSAGADSRQAASAPTELYLTLATQLVEKDPALAVSVAEKASRAAVTARTLEFLATLRKKDSNLANAFFATVLRSISARPGSHVNELLLLYSYVFSPTRVPLLTAQGLVLQQLPGYMQAAQEYPVVPEIAAGYLQASARTLLSAERYGAENAALNA
ncbi:MAG TPA: hypothetical protein VF766_14750, partial [Pyrinomonadaceae bacterium]